MSVSDLYEIDDDHSMADWFALCGCSFLRRKVQPVSSGSVAQQGEEQVQQGHEQQGEEQQKLSKKKNKKRKSHDSSTTAEMRKTRKRNAKEKKKEPVQRDEQQGDKGEEDAGEQQQEEEEDGADGIREQEADAEEDSRASDAFHWPTIAAQLTSSVEALRDAMKEFVQQYYTLHPLCSCVEIEQSVYKRLRRMCVEHAYGELRRAQLLAPDIDVAKFLDYIVVERADEFCFPRFARAEFFPPTIDELNAFATVGGTSTASNSNSTAFLPLGTASTGNAHSSRIYSSAAAMSSALFGGRRTMFEFQFRDVVRIILSGESRAINWSMGLGKSTCGLALIKHEILWRRNNNQPLLPALVVAPLPVLSNWRDEALEYAFSPADWHRVWIYHGEKRKSKTKRGMFGYSLLAYVDNARRVPEEYEEIPSEETLLVLTTYEVLKNDISNRFLPRLSMVILDEAHKIRSARFSGSGGGGGGRNNDEEGDGEEEDENEGDEDEDGEYLEQSVRKSKSAAAVFALIKRTEKRYALSGTPYVNSMLDFLPIARFLNCGPSKDNIEHFTRARGEQRAIRLAEWRERFMIVRRKEDVLADFPGGLPDKFQHVSHLLMGDIERSEYNKMVSGCREEEEKEEEKKSKKKKISRQAAIVSLRQHCLSSMINSEKEKILQWFVEPATIVSSRLLRAVRESVKLRTVLSDIYRFSYTHAAKALYDIDSYVAARKEKEAAARGKEKEDDDGSSESSEDLPFDFLLPHAEDLPPIGPQTLCGERVVVCSESKIGVKLLSMCLADAGVRRYLGVEHLPVPVAIVYTGEIDTAEERDRLVYSFTRKDGAEPHADGRAFVFLMTRACGGLGLNLAIARHMIIVDGWWNDAAVSQAIDRVHRFGQRRTVYVHRYPIEGSIEQYLLLVEARKQQETMQLWGTNAQQQAAAQRVGALKEKKVDEMLKDKEQFMSRYGVIPSRRRGSSVGCNQFTLSTSLFCCAMQENDLALAEHLLRSSRYALSNDFMRRFVADVRELDERVAVECLRESQMVEVERDEAFLAVVAASVPQNAMQIFTRGDKQSLTRWRAEAELLTREHRNLAVSFLDGLLQASSAESENKK